MFEVLLYYLGFSLIINVGVFVIAYLLQSDTFTDITYAFTFIVLIVVSFVLQAFDILKLVYTLMVVTWATRLGSYLFMRIQFFGFDKRFDIFRDDFFKFFGFFLLQGITVFVILIPGFLFMQSGDSVFSWVAILGIVLWVIGFYFEAVSDRQKFAFIKDKKNKGKFISTGLWKYSRHPNYFGEILCWLGLFFVVCPTLKLSGFLTVAVGFISPLFIFLLLRFFSGIPILERSAQKKYGDQKTYKDYVKRTGLLIPRLF